MSLSIKELAAIATGYVILIVAFNFVNNTNLELSMILAIMISLFYLQMRVRYEEAWEMDCKRRLDLIRQIAIVGSQSYEGRGCDDILALIDAKDLKR